MFLGRLGGPGPSIMFLSSSVLYVAGASAVPLLSFAQRRTVTATRAQLKASHWQLQLHKLIRFSCTVVQLASIMGFV